MVKPFLGSVVCAISQPWFYISELSLEHKYYIQYTTECIQKCNISITFDPSAAHLRIMGFWEAWSRSAVSWICNELEPRIQIISDPAPDNCSSICKVSWSRAQPYFRFLADGAQQLRVTWLLTISDCSHKLWEQNDIYHYMFLIKTVCARVKIQLPKSGRMGCFSDLMGAQRAPMLPNSVGIVINIDLSVYLCQFLINQWGIIYHWNQKNQLCSMELLWRHSKYN